MIHPATMIALAKAPQANGQAITSNGLTQIVVLADEAAYNALPVKDPNTLYIWA